MKTSYFAVMRKMDWEKHAPFSIARVTPHWSSPRPMKVPVLMPTEALLSDYKQEKLSWEEYVTRFDSEVLEHLRGEASKVRSALETMASGREPVLLCWEKDRTRCHRGLVADWFESELGVEVEELLLPGG